MPSIISEYRSKPTCSYHEVEAFDVRQGIEQTRSLGCRNSSSNKIVYLCLCGILLPLFWIALPVYAKHIYESSLITIGISETLLLDGNMSTIWCQGQTLKMNENFNSYLMNEPPSLLPTAQNLSKSYNFELDDDLKEYWGFYLLKGSEMTVKSCSRQLGASVMMVKGKKSLRHCTYSDVESIEEDDDIESTTVPSPVENRAINATNLDVNSNKDEAFEEDVENTDYIDRNDVESDSDSGDISMTSSSEEAMRKCDGIVFSQPIIAEDDCGSNDSEPRLNTIRYTVEENEYYYFVFSSGYEKGQNAMTVKFDFLKMTYNLEDAELSCTNATECNFPFRFASNQKIIVSLAATENRSNHLNDTFLMQSLCQPRTPLYLAFGLTLPILVCSFAFI